MSDGRRFDELTRIRASPMSRRRALRLSAGTVFGAVGANLLSTTHLGAQPTACTTNDQCPPAEVCRVAARSTR
jgi:hypothetical protein